MKKFLTTDKIFWIVLIFCTILLFVTGFFAVDAYLSNNQYEIQMLQNQGRKLTTVFDHELSVQAVTLEILGAEVQSMVAGDVTPANSASSSLIASEDSQGYLVSNPELKNTMQIGSLTGLGAIPEPGSTLAREIDMAFSLTPEFEQVINNYHNIQWVYYTSVNRFIYMYPRISPDDFFFSNVLYETEFFKIATPQNNPERLLVWSAPYEDQAGAGRMVTISKPVYDDNTFIGVLSIDILTKDLQWLLESSETTNATAYLVGPDWENIVQLGSDRFSKDELSVTPETPAKVNGKTIMVFPLTETEWYIILEVNQANITSSSISSSIGEIVIFLFTVFSVILMLVIYNSMRSARYLAEHDNLTGILNRRSFEELSVSTLRKNALNNTYLGTVVVDIDYFKKFNDCYGHQAGDETLRQVANELKSCLRTSADRVFRIGGEEFVVIVTLNTPDDLPQILDRLINGVNNLKIPHAQSPFGTITISAGGVIDKFVSITSLDETYIRADKALYIAKDSGRNCWSIV